MLGDVHEDRLTSTSSSSSSSPRRSAAATISRTLVREPQPSSICLLRSVANASPSSARGRLADLLASRVEDGQLLLGEVVVDRLGELLDRVVEGLGVGALELEHLQQRLVPLGVLLLAVLGLVLADRAACGAASGRRASPRPARARRAGSRRPGVRRRGPFAAVAQVAQQRLEAAVVLEDQLDDVAGDRACRDRWAVLVRLRRHPRSRHVPRTVSPGRTRCPRGPASR